jgi:hypothetical protein
MKQPDFPVEKQFPDTAQGAIDALLDMSVFKREEVTGAIPDPSVEGVWLVRLKLKWDPDTNGAIVFLAGYRDPWGQVRAHNDFECGSFDEGDRND